jgi:hypothetical protein
MSKMVRRVASVLCALLIAGAIVAAAALADGDPASDALLGQNVFYPFGSLPPASVRHDLNRLTDRARAVKLPIKVALINRPFDLGVIPSLYGKPQAYAAYLEKELSFHGPQPLLVVMYDGYGVEGFDGQAVTAAGSLAKPKGEKGRNETELAQAAAAAIPKLAQADGHPLTVSRTPVSSANSSGSGGVGRGLLLVILVLAAVIVAGMLILLRLRQALRAHAD